jgi:hypothetical protein
LLPGTRGGNYTLHCPPGSAIESVTGLCRTDNPYGNRYIGTYLGCSSMDVIVNICPQ